MACQGVVLMIVIDAGDLLHGLSPARKNITSRGHAEASDRYREANETPQWDGQHSFSNIEARHTDSSIRSDMASEQ